MNKKRNFWSGLLLGIAVVAIVVLVSALLGLIDHVHRDHQSIFERLQKLEQKRGDR